MAPNCLNSTSASTHFSIYSALTFSLVLLEFVLMLSFIPQTMTTPSRHQGKALADPFAVSDFDFDWESMDNLRLWRWRNRNRTLRQREREARKARQFQAQHRRLTSDWYRVPKPAKRGGSGVGPDRSRFLMRKKTDPTLELVDFQDSCCPTIKELVSPTSGRNATGHLVELYQDDKIHQQFYEVSCRRDIVNQPCKFLENRHSRSSMCTQQHMLTYALVRSHINETPPLLSAYNYNGPQPQGQEHILKIPSQDQHLQSMYASETPNYVQQGPRNHGYIGVIAAMMSNGAILQHPWYLDYITIRSGCSCQVVRTRRWKKAF